MEKWIKIPVMIIIWAIAIGFIGVAIAFMYGVYLAFTMPI